MEEEEQDRTRISVEGAVPVTIGRRVSPASFDVAFASTDSSGSVGRLMSYVQSELGEPPTPLHDSRLVSDGFHSRLTARSVRVVLVVTVPGDVRANLARNLGRALHALRAQIAGNTVWLPLMGTGDGGMGSLVSLDTTIGTLGPLLDGPAAERPADVHISLAEETSDADAADLTEAARLALAGRGAAAPSETSATRSTSGEGIEIRLLERDATTPTLWNVAPDLRHLLGVAARFNRETSDERSFALSFKSLLLAAGRADAALLASKGLTAARAAEIMGMRLEPSDFAEPMRATTSACRLLATARGYAEPLNVLPAVRHLLAALIFDPGEHKLDFVAYGIDRAAWARALIDEVASRHPSETPLFRQLCAAVFPDLSPAPPEPSPFWDRARLDTDRVGGAIPLVADLLDAGKPAKRFAKLLAADDVRPPIAVGLFGNWGSGKTFFMGLMQSHIVELCDLAKKGDKAYVKRVAQIEFNAWHYQDSNLWACLATHIFDRLGDELAKDVGAAPTVSDAEGKRLELRKQMESSQERLRDAKARRDVALARRVDAAKDLDEDRARRAQLAEDDVVRRVKAAWAIVRDDPKYAKLRDAADGLAKRLGLAKLGGAAQDVARLRADLDAVRAKSATLRAAVGRRFSDGWSASLTVAAAAAVVLVAVALGGPLTRLVESLGLPELSRFVVQAAVPLGAAATWCGRRVHEVRAAMDLVGEVETKLADETAKQAVDPKLQAALDALDKEIHRAGEDALGAEREIAEATKEIDRINAGGLVYDFLQERRGSSSYVAQLGLITTIRRDLEKLKDLLDDLKGEGKDPIGRIVLYIDDLDRCHPDKVVEVLQAVHLLLAFDLFNVVVGVDARWLERSLRRQYVGRQGGARKDEDNEFSPQDYLEKIFQIPYALAPIDKDGVGKLIGDLMETRSDSKTKRENAAKKTAEEKRAHPAGDPNTAHGETKPPDASMEPEQDKDSEEPDADFAARKSKAADLAATAASTETLLLFEDHEETLIKGLHAFIDQPRRAKKLVNIYRLLRVGAHEEGRTTFAATADADDYKAVLVLLAISVGHPKVAGLVFSAIVGAGDDTDLAGVVDGLRRRKGAPAPLDRTKLDDLDRVAAKLRALDVDVPASLAAYRPWVGRVGAFSFDWRRADSRPNAPEAAPKA